MDLSEKRKHQRLELSYPVSVKLQEDVFEALLKDLSQSGAKVLLNKDAPIPNDSKLELIFKIPEKLNLSVFCTIRRQEQQNDGLSLGLEFHLEQAGLIRQITALIEFFISGDEENTNTKVSRRLPIPFGELSELEAVIENISMGGLAMSVPRELELYEPVEISVPNLQGDELLVLKGRVVHQYPIENTDYFRIGIEFDEMNPASQKCLKELMYEILELTPS